MKISGKHISLRALELEDIDYLYFTENHPDFALFGEPHPPYSKSLLKDYIAQAHKSIYEVQQIRLVIENNKDLKPVGLIDLFDFNPLNKRAALGVLISDPNDRRKGFAREAADLILKYAFNDLELNQVYALVVKDNIASRALFTSLSFKSSVTIKKWWRKGFNQYEDMVLFQKFNPVVNEA